MDTAAELAKNSQELRVLGGEGRLAVALHVEAADHAGLARRSGTASSERVCRRPAT